jgi:glycosyltransferase involved in cell wall biosynthesis
MAKSHAADVLLVSLGSTAGLRRADDELQDSLRRAGAHVAVARPFPPEPLPTLMLTDLVWAQAARRAAAEIIEQQRSSPARAVIYSTTTAALLWKRPGAIRFDATAAANRRGRHGLWQRPLERRRLRQAPLLLPWSDGGLAELGEGGARERSLVLPVPVVPSGPAPAVRDLAAVTYAANPSKKGLDRVLQAWRRVREQSAGAKQPPDELVIGGASAAQLEQMKLVEPGEPGVRVVGALAPEDFRALLRRARVFVCAPRREDYGIAQLEALADGCQLVTTPAPGPYVALPIARQLDARLVGEDLAAALRAALDDPLPDYAERAHAALAPFTREAADRIVVEQLLPRLLA